MIKVNGLVVKPTIFPDGTSQIWKLPEGIFSFPYIKITWYFEAEREIIDIYSIKALIPAKRHVTLYMPYLPYARQDKPVSNTSTFNLEVFAQLINALNFNVVMATDVHNPARTSALINHFTNLDVDSFRVNLIGLIKPDCIVYPDAGARERYPLYEDELPSIVYTKSRDAKSGNILKHDVLESSAKAASAMAEKQAPRFLIVDDLCDGGATFISIAENLKQWFKDCDIHLFVTHGIFSKGMKPLTDAGIKVYTTNSLIKNTEGYNV